MSLVEEFDFPKAHENGQFSVIIRDPKHGVLRRFLNSKEEALSELKAMPIGAKRRETLLNAQEALVKIQKGRIIFVDLADRIETVMSELSRV